MTNKEMKTIDFGNGVTYEVTDEYARNQITGIDQDITGINQDIVAINQRIDHIPSSQANTGFSCWEGKTAVCVGDSITAGSGVTDTNKRYYNQLKDILNLESVTGMGVAGSCVSATSNYGNNNQPLIKRYTSIPTGKDLVTVYMGTNDYGHETPMGTIADTTDISFYGALNVIIPGILNRCTTSRLVWITPSRRYGFGKNGNNVSFTYDWLPNASGYTLLDYVNAIKEVCSRYSVPVIDLYNMSGLQPCISYIKSTYMPDGLHPNDLAHTKIAVYLAKELNMISEYLPVTSSQIVDVTGITLNKNSTVIQTGGNTDTLIATVSPPNATLKDVAWYITSGEDFVQITPNNNTCTVTSKSGSGTAVISAQAGNFIAQCTVTTTSASIPVTGVSISGLDTVSVGSNITLTANVVPENASNKTVLWNITSGSDVVTMTTDSEHNTCTITGVAEGSADITVATQDGNYTDTKTITINVAPAELWTLTYGNRYSAQVDQKNSHARLTPDTCNYYFHAGDHVALKDSISYKYQMGTQSSEDLTSTVKWGAGGASSWTKNAWDIPSTGWYTVALLKDPEADFVLVADGGTDSNNVFDYLNITYVGPVPATGVTISGETSVNIGSTIDLTATVTPEDATDKNVTWLITDGNEHASISASGATCTVTGISAGSTSIRVTTVDGGFTDTVTLTVVDSGATIPVTGMTITASTNTLTVGTTAVILSHITPEYATNKSVAWSLTSGSNHATMEPSVDTTTCTVTGTSAGTVVVTGTSVDGGFTDTATINVVEVSSNWELNYGNRYGNSSQQSTHTRLTPTTVNYYFEKDTVISLKDTTNYFWQMASRNSVDDFRQISKWEIPTQSGEYSGAWTKTPSYAIPKSGWYAIAFTKDPNTDNFVLVADGGTDSNNAFDYITVSTGA